MLHFGLLRAQHALPYGLLQPSFILTDDGTANLAPSRIVTTVGIQSRVQTA